MKPSASDPAAPKILFMSRSMPPAISGSAVIVANLAKQFTPDTMALLGPYDPGMPGIEWSPAWPRRHYAMLWANRWRGERWLRRLQFPFLLLMALWLTLVRRCKAILVVFPDEWHLLAAYLVSRLTGRPLYPYFHNTYVENQPGKWFAQWLQGRVFAHARHVFVMSEGMQRLYNEKYPGVDCSPLKHTFNDPLPAFESPPVHAPLRLCLSGTMNRASSDAAGRMAEVVRALGDEAQLSIFTGSTVAEVEAIGFRGSNVSIGTVSRDELMTRIRESDILLLPHGFASSWSKEEIQTIFPTKVIEYLISGRPILAHLPADCFLAEFLRRHDCALIVDEPDVTALKHSLDALRNDQALRDKLVRNALDAARQFEAPTVAAYLRETIAHHNAAGQ